MLSSSWDSHTNHKVFLQWTPLHHQGYHILPTNERSGEGFCPSSIVLTVCNSSRLVRKDSIGHIYKHEQILSSWWFQPIWKILYSQNGNLPQIGVKTKNIWNHHPVLYRKSISKSQTSSIPTKNLPVPKPLKSEIRLLNPMKLRPRYLHWEPGKQHPAGAWTIWICNIKRFKRNIIWPGRNAYLLQ